MSHMIRCHYVDASALVKLIADDDAEKDGRAELREYYWKNTANMYATSHSVTEALSIIKGKYKRDKIDRDTYTEWVNKFLIQTIGANLRIEDDEEEAPILSQTVRSEAKLMIEKHDIDFLDAFQLIVIMRGRFRHMTDGSQTMLVTADRGLARAAKSEGLRSWCCLDEPMPHLTEVKEKWWTNQ
jgi:predicted nucleic acid-binding protein